MSRWDTMHCRDGTSPQGRTALRMTSARHGAARLLAGLGIGRAPGGWPACVARSVTIAAWLAVLAVAARYAGPVEAQEPGSPLNPASPLARGISDIFVIALLMSVGVLALVWALLAYCIVRFRARPGDPLPRQVQGNTRLEIGWTVAPALVLAVLAAIELPHIFAAEARPPNAVNVVATGNRFWWEFEYPDLGVLTANELHLPTGVPMRVQLKSADVIHGFWIPRLNGKTDMTPGWTNDTVLYTDQADTYLGQCTELCGLQHAWMLLRVIAEPRDRFDAWVARERAPAAAPADDLARRGQQLFDTNACGNCHTIRGTPAAGRAAPDLTHVGSRETLAAGALRNTPEDLHRWLDNPQAIKPGAMMPTFRLSDDELAALTAYLGSLK
jgi:cytochrome c oxidase subunit II